VCGVWCVLVCVMWCVVCVCLCGMYCVLCFAYVVCYVLCVVCCVLCVVYCVLCCIICVVFCLCCVLCVVYCVLLNIHRMYTHPTTQHIIHKRHDTRTQIQSRGQCTFPDTRRGDAPRADWAYISRWKKNHHRCDDLFSGTRSRLCLPAIRQPHVCSSRYHHSKSLCGR
jgi:hypothetical protein